MPVGKVSKSGNSFSGAAEYDLAQGKYRRENKSKKPVILEQNRISSSYYKEIGRDFRELANENKNCKKPVLKFSISFDPNEALTDKQKIDFTKNVMLELGITEDHQYMITRHSDKAHDHHHIIVNRVGIDGKVINDSFIINRLETAVDKIEKQMGFLNILADKRRFVYDESSEKGYTVQTSNFSSNKKIKSTRDAKVGVQNSKSYLQENILNALTIAKSLNDLYLILKQNKIEMQMRFNNSQKLTGISFLYNNLSVKGSALGSQFKAANIEKIIHLNSSANKENEIVIKEELKEVIEPVNDSLNQLNTISSSSKDYKDILLEDIAKINAIINTTL